MSISRDSVRVSCFGFSGRHGSHRPPLFAEQCTSILLRFPHMHLPRGGFGVSVTRSVRRLDRPLGFEVSFSAFVHQSKGIVSARQGVQNPHIPCMCRSGTASSHVAVSASYGSLRCEGGTGVVDGDVTWTVRVLDDHVSSTLASTLLACPPSLVARMAVCLYVALSRSQCHGRGRAIVLRCPLARLQEPHGAASGTSPRLLTFISVGRVPRQNAYTCVTQSVSSRRRRLQRPQRVSLLCMPLRYVIAWAPLRGMSRADQGCCGSQHPVAVFVERWTRASLRSHTRYVFQPFSPFVLRLHPSVQL